MAASWGMNDTVPELKDFAYVVTIDANSNIAVMIQNSEDLKFLSNTADVKPLENFFTGVKPAVANTKTAKAKFEPIVIIKPDTSLNFGILVGVIKKIRDASGLPVKVETAPNYYVFVSRPPTGNIIDRPNPLFLIAGLDKELNIWLNQEPLGSLNDTKSFSERLITIFKEREANGVYRELSNEVETTVHVKAHPAVNFSDVVKLIEVLRATGAKPIGFDLDSSPEFKPLQPKGDPRYKM